MLLAGAIAVNLILLGYFKYANFFAENINNLAGTSLSIGQVVLPLGISFFTFTQIAFLVDTYQGKVKEYNFVHYTLFVTYFPHLIAGPVLHHKEMMPQFAKPNVCHINWNNVAVGFTIFVLGLAKKVFIADSLADFSTPIFNAAAGGQLMLIEAWVGALAYTLQLYFDFSAYSDMAIGLSLMFNVRLPLNFNFPYKATSIIEFWRHWHLPNVRQIFRHYRPVCEDMREPSGDIPNAETPSILTSKIGRLFEWKPTMGYAWATGAMFALAVMSLTHVSEFLYFQF